MNKQIFLSLIVAAFVSCTKTIDFDDEGLANQVVVNSIISTDSFFSAHLSKSGSILSDRQPNPPTEGTMELYEDGVLIRQFSSQLGGFSATDIIPQAGKSYRMVITSNGKQIITETTIPLPADLISADTSTVKNEYGYKSTNYKIRIKDNQGDDFYRVIVMNESLVQMKDDGKKSWRYYYSKVPQWISSDDPVFKSVYNNFGNDLIDYGPNNDFYIFPDSYFQGKEYSVQFQIWPTGYGYYNTGYAGYDNNPNSPYKTIFNRQTVHIQKLSKDFYNYLKYLKLHNHYRDNPFAEPVPVYSNVQNGAGIFASFNNEAKFTFEKIYIPFSMDTIKVEEHDYGYNYGGGY